METIKLVIDPPVAVVTLNRPEVRNALSPELIHDFEQALDEIQKAEGVAAVIVTGEGPAFCAGADLSSLQKMTTQPAEDARQDSMRIMHFFRRLYQFPKPVIAAVNGPAMGGGCGLASVCDIIVSAEDAIFGYTELKVGFIPALVSVFLTRICGEKKTRELLLTARTFSAQEAQQIGLVNHVVARDALLSKARELAEAISKNSPLGVTFTKELIGRMRGLNLDEALAAAVELNILTRTTEDFKEGITAFLEKRTPKWKRS